MAKKHGTNFIEAHIEKVVLALALVVFGWVVYSYVLSPDGVRLDSDTMSAQEATGKAADLTDDIIRTPPPLEPVPAWQPQADSLFAGVTPYEGKAVRLGPPIIDDLNVEDPRGYVVPDIPGLQDIKVQLTQDLVLRSAEGESRSQEPTLPGGMFAGRTSDMVQTDIDFVTVSATFSMEDLFNAFERNFGPGGIEKPLDQYEPVVAYVNLQRRSLLPDGSWSPPQTIQRDTEDPMKNIEISPEEIGRLSETQYQVTLNDRFNYQNQIKLLQPMPPRLVNPSAWESPSGEESPERGRAPSPGPAGPGPGGIPGIFGPPMGIPMPMPMGQPGVGRRPRQGEGTVDQIKKKDLKIWAIDTQVTPGDIYTYELQLGFFNPIADKDWYKDEAQKDLKYQRILWSPPSSEKAVIRIPLRTVFFPKDSPGKFTGNQIRIDVYRKQVGNWYKKTFRVSPGSEIGDVLEQKMAEEAAPRGPMNIMGMPASTKQDQTIEVDYRTGATLIDVVPDNMRWYVKPHLAKPVQCTDIIYRDRDGSIQRMGTDKTTWPDELGKLQSTIIRAMRQQE
ncbi:MAG: hypothetical protein JW860_03765 [Sedimentisphaerales bacterium]|nr:hypothetical protein [Sedimentisphaerales bacterium]